MVEDSAPTAPSDQLTVRQPTRGSDRNQDLVDRAEPANDGRLLPSLEDGVTLLDIEGGRGSPVLHSLVLDHLLLHDGPAFWVDANGHATTTSLARIAPSRRLLDRIHVARGFTAYQHYGAVCDLPTAVNRFVQHSTAATDARGQQPSTRDTNSAPRTPSLVVAPAVDATYRADDTLGERHAETLQSRALARLVTYADSYDVPVLVTRTARDEFTEPIVSATDQHLECTRTRLGPRFVGDDSETLVYPVDDGAYYQTTVAYWQQLLAARATQVGVEPAPSSTTDDDVGTGVTPDGEPISVSAKPLLDAWTAGVGGR